MRFFKMHGAGNDFVILEDMDAALPLARVPALTRTLCARHTGVGADGLMLVVPAEKGGDYGMLFYNSDGSLGEMCGNGARCICRYGYERGLAGDTQRVETTAGIVIGRRIAPSHYRIRLNDPSVLDLHRRVTACGREYDCTYLELGSPGLPHAVVLLDGWAQYGRDTLLPLARALRASRAFPKGANVSFVHASGTGSVSAVTYERGVEDFTLACGTGCGAIAAALILRGLVPGPEVTVSMPGGELSVRLTAEHGAVSDIFLTGPALFICEGTISEELLEETCTIS